MKRNKRERGERQRSEPPGSGSQYIQMEIRSHLPLGPDIIRVLKITAMAMQCTRCIWMQLVIFDVQTSYGCLKVSEIYQESDSEVKNHLRQCLRSENKLLCYCGFFPCDSNLYPFTTKNWEYRLTPATSIVLKYIF